MPTIAANFLLDAQSGLDARTKFPSVSAALQGLPISRRATDIFVQILADERVGDGATRWYQFQGGLTDDHFQPVPWETLRLLYAQLPLADTVADVQDINVGEMATFRPTAIPPRSGWLQVIPGQTFDRIRYPALYAALNSNILPNATSAEGTVWIKAEQVSVQRTDTMTPIEYIGGAYDVQLATMLANFNTLVADLNFHEELRKEILGQVVGLPAVPTESWATLKAWLNMMKQLCANLLNSKFVPANRHEPLYDLIAKIGDIQAQATAANPGMRVECRIGETVVQQDNPGPGWLECNGQELDHPLTTGQTCIYPEYFHYFYNTTGTVTSHPVFQYGPVCVTTPRMTSNTEPSPARVRGYRGDTETPVVFTSNLEFNLFQGTAGAVLPRTAYNWTDTQPYYLEFEYMSGQRNLQARRNLCGLEIVFATHSPTSISYPTHFILQGWDPSEGGTGGWVDLLQVDDMPAPDADNLTRRWNFDSARRVTAWRLKCTNGTLATTHHATNSIAGINWIRVLERNGLVLPNTSTPTRKTWIKVASGNNDFGLNLQKRKIGSPEVMINSLCFLDDYSDSAAAGFRRPQATGPTAAGSAMNICASAKVQHNGIDYYFLATNQRGGSTTGNSQSNFWVMRDQDLLTGTTISGREIVLPDRNRVNAEPICLFFDPNGDLWIKWTQWALMKLENLDELTSATPRNAFVQKMNVSWTAAALPNRPLNTIVNSYHFNWGNEHYSYELHSVAPWITCRRWNLDVDPVPDPVLVPLSPDPGFTTAFAAQSPTTGPYRWFRHPTTNVLYFIVRMTNTTLRLYRQDAPETLSLLTEYTSPNGATMDMALGYNDDDMLIYGGKAYFGCAMNHGGYDPIIGSGSGTGNRRSLFLSYDFAANRFEPVYVRNKRGYADIARTSQTVMFQLGDDFYMDSADVAGRIDLERGVIVYEPLYSGTNTVFSGHRVRVFDKDKGYIWLSPTGGISHNIIAMTRPALMTPQGVGLGVTASGRSFVARQGGLVNQEINVQELSHWPLVHRPILVDGSTSGIGTGIQHLMPQTPVQ